MNEKDNKENIENAYHDLEGLTKEKLNFGLWYVENRAFFIKLIKILLVLIAAVTWPIFLYTFGKYIFTGMKQDNVLLAEMDRKILSTGNIHITSNIEIVQVKIFRSGEKYDLAAQIRNPDLHYGAQFDYIFSANGGQELSRSRGFVLPNETKYISILGITLATEPNNIQLELKNKKMHRIDAHLIRDLEKFKTDHLNIIASNISYNQEPSTGSDKIRSSNLEFTISNQTAYNYTEVPLGIYLMNLGNLVGLNSYTLHNFRSGESRIVKMSVFDPPYNVDQELILPEINILSNDIYSRFQGDPNNSDPRDK